MYGILLYNAYNLSCFVDVEAGFWSLWCTCVAAKVAMSCAILCRAYSAVCWILDFIFVCTWLNKNFLLIFQKRKKKKEKRIHDRYSNTNCCKTKFSSLLPAFGSQMEHQNTQLSWKIIVKLHILRLILLAYTRGKKKKKEEKKRKGKAT